ncbi:MAG: translation initiation factor IF-2, partial [Bacteroidia bacterium]|nr:translation initiation factor IF-2 [Bacteroidia bacterium]
MAGIRLAKAASEFNQGSQNIVDFLNEKGFSLENKPTTKITDEMHQLLVQNFSASKAAKDKVNTLLAKREATPPKAPAVTPPKKEELKVEKTVVKEVPVEVEKPKVVDPPKVTEKPKMVDPTPEETPVKEEPKIEEKSKEKKVGPKVVGAITVDQKKPKTKKPVEVEKKIVEKPKVEIKKKEKPKEEEEEEEKIEKEETEEEKKITTQFTKLTGTKVVSKISLPNDKPKGVRSLANDAREELKEKRKRKRKKVSAEKVSVNDKIKEDSRKKDDKTGNKKPVSKRDVNSNLKRTRGHMGGAGRGRGNRQKHKNQKRERSEIERKEEMARLQAESSILKVTEFLTANDLAIMMEIGVNDVISTCFKLGLMVSINQRLDAETIQVVADEYGYEIEFVDAESQDEGIDEIEDSPEDLSTRAPIVTVMGHVDHGKTSLLDYIRKSSVIDGEAGGITQHIGSYSVNLGDNKQITFLDTPGHEAFTAMRARGAKVTDLAIIVIAADDSIMPQTREAIAHAQAAGVPMIFAFNKMDKDGANADRIREALSAMNILVEDWGGKFQSQEISAKKGTNIDELLEKVLLESEIMELKANPDRPAKGAVIEARMEKGRGVVCDMLVQTGTLRVGDHVVAGPNYAKVRALMDAQGNKISEAGPSTPVKILGYSDAPTAGDTFAVMDESSAKELANKRSQLIREQGIRTTKHITLDEISRRLQVGDFQELKIIVKGDVDGSVEALKDSLLKLSTEEISVNVIFSGVGAISESDVLLASASDAIIVGFQIRPSAKAKALAEEENIEIKTYSIIYKAIEEIKSAMEGMLSPDLVEKVTGQVEIRETFKISKVGT